MVELCTVLAFVTDCFWPLNATPMIVHRRRTWRLRFFTRLAVYGSEAEILTTLLIDLPVWGANYSKISSILNYEKVARTMFYSIIWRLLISVMTRDAKPKSEGESITFRVERNVLEKLRAEAERKMGSVNILGNQIFKEYVYWHYYAFFFFQFISLFYIKYKTNTTSDTHKWNSSLCLLSNHA